MIWFGMLVSGCFWLMSIRIWPRPLATRRAGAAGDCTALAADATKAKTELGWDPKHADLKEIVQSAWDWHQAHPGGYEQSIS